MSKKRFIIAGALAAVAAAAYGRKAKAEPQFIYYRASQPAGEGLGIGSAIGKDTLTGAIDGLLGKLGVFGGEMPPTPVTGRKTGVKHVKAGVGAILDVIGRAEGGLKGYNAYYGGIAAADAPPLPVTRMTVAEVLNWQKSIDHKYNSEAVGRYQIMEDTLRELVGRGVVRPSDRFNKATQDKLGTALMKRRGLRDYQAGKISANQFADNLAKEWAGLPLTTGPRAGKSYYDKFNGNSATTTVDAVLGALKEIV